MKILCIIPARYKSTRFQVSPLADIHGKPMIWWTFQKAIQVKEFFEVIVATDDNRIVETCSKLGIPTILTSEEHENHVLRIAEVATVKDADYYVCVNGDEPLILPDNIRKIIPRQKSNGCYAGYLMRELTDPVETMDPANIKLTTLGNGTVIYMSRSVIPYPKGTLDFKYKKLIGVECFNKEALEFYSKTPMGEHEKIEDIDHLRFIENNKKVLVTMVDGESLSVDTPKDLEKVRSILTNEV